MSIVQIKYGSLWRPSRPGLLASGASASSHSGRTGPISTYPVIRCPGVQHLSMSCRPNTQIYPYPAVCMSSRSYNQSSPYPVYIQTQCSVGHLRYQASGLLHNPGQETQSPISQFHINRTINPSSPVICSEPDVSCCGG